MSGVFEPHKWSDSPHSREYQPQSTVSRRESDEVLGYGTAAMAALLSSTQAFAQSPSPAVATAPTATAPAEVRVSDPVVVPSLPPTPPGVSPPFGSGEWKFGFHGFAGGSFYVQDTPGLVLNGQGPLLVLSKPSGGLTTGADVRQSRFNFSLAGPKVLGGATPKAVVEIDLFGFNSPGGYGEVSVYPRLRLAYAELSWGNDVLRFGQDHELILGMIPESVGHLAYPATYFNGLLGWREPGISYLHSMPLGGSKLEFAGQIIKSDWRNPTDFGQSTVNDLNVDYGQLSGLPGVELRVKWSSDHVTSFIAGHYNRVEGTRADGLVAPPTTGTPPVPAIPNRNWDVIAGVAGLKANAFGFTLLANGYVGKNLGPLMGALLQFPTTHDVNEWGGWAQLGYAITSNLSAWGIGGLARPKRSDMLATGGGRIQSSVAGGMVRYQEGGFAIGAEYYHVMAKNQDANGSGVASGAGAQNGVLNVNQGMLSGMYFF